MTGSMTTRDAPGGTGSSALLLSDCSGDCRGGGTPSSAKVLSDRDFGSKTLYRASFKVHIRRGYLLTQG